MTYRKKLIEVALPLDAINKASAKEKSIRQGHPSTFHLWWSRKPLATCRAVLFASLVDDPSEHPEQFPTKADQERERRRLFQLIEELVKWENSNNQDMLAQAQVEIQKSTGDSAPALHDPFAGGGSIPLEAQRLGLESHASDLNPVAVLINKALIEIPPKFANRPPVNPDGSQLLGNQYNNWKGAHGLTNDIRYYGRWMRDEAEKRIGQLYPKATLPDGSRATVIAWLWVRTIPCPNPACGAQIPLTSKWWLSKKKGKEVWAEPVIDHMTTPPTIKFAIKTGQGKPQDGTVSKRGAICAVCNAISPLTYVRTEAQAGRMGVTPLAIVAEGSKSRVYLAPDSEHEKIARSAQPRWKPEELVTTPSHSIDRLPMYGMYTWGDAFTSRQLVALTTFSDLVQEVRERVLADAVAAHLPADERPLHAGGCGALAYADAVATYLGINISRLANRCSGFCFWDTMGENVQQVFARQAIPMIWDFVEGNPFSESTGNFLGQIHYLTQVLEMSSYNVSGEARQQDAIAYTISDSEMRPMISTDPPYYDNIGYAVM